jgi:DNA replication and repair protein RecF
MHITHLHLLNFKNWTEASLDFSPKVNCFVGPNGSGKTNMLDALHYLSTSKSYLNPIDGQNIMDETAFMMLEADINLKDQQHKLHFALKRGQKKVFKKNKKEYERLADHIGQFPCVIISPYDRDLITEGSEVRRKFMDGVIAQSDGIYLDSLLKYNKALAQRNALLKFFAANHTFDRDSLDAFDYQLITLSTYLHDKRIAFANQLNKKLHSYYSWLAGSDEQADLVYKSQMHDSSLKDLLSANLQRDMHLQYTGVGPHKDDLLFRLFEKPMKKFGSQGQQKSFLVALKLAQYDFIKEKQQINPFLLLDDIFDKLDEARVHQLVGLVGKENFGQIFITDTHEARTRDILMKLDTEAKIFNVKNGSIHEAG